MKKDELVQYLKSQRTAVLSTVDSNNSPHAAVMYFRVDEKLNFFLLTKSTTRKYKNVKENNQVALTILDKKEPKTVQVRGAIEEMPKDSQEYLDTLTEMATKNANQNGSSWPPPLSKIPDADIIVLKLVPNWLRFSDFTNRDEEVFSQIIPE